MTEHPVPSQPAPEEQQHASGDLHHAEDAPAAEEPPTTRLDLEVDESLPLDAVEESQEKWWESEADARA